MKRLSTILLCGLLLCAATGAARAQTVGTGATGPLTWTVTGPVNNYTLTISGTGAMPDYTSVTNVPWYAHKNEIMRVVVSEGVTRIGAYAFCDYGGIESMSLPNSVTSIGRRAFYLCDGLMSATIPNSVTTIENDAFYGCTGLESLSLSNTLTVIGDNAFENCAGLASITLPGSLTTIGDAAFAECASLRSITIPNSVTSVGFAAFTECYRMESIVLSQSMTAISELMFNGCDGLKSVNIPASVTSIGENAFDNCRALKKVVIPASVTSIGYLAFIECTALDTIVNHAAEPQMIDDADVFDGVTTSDVVLVVPAASEAAYRSAAVWKTFRIVVLVTGVTLNKTTATINTGVTETLIATVQPANATNRNVVWSSSNPSVATVSPAGVVTGVGPGTAYITVTTQEGAYAARCTVTVTQPATGVTVSDPTASIMVDETKQLTANVEPGDASNDQVTWSSSDESIATVSPDGVVTGVGPGTAYITVTTQDGGFQAQCAVTVIQPVTGVTVSDPTASIMVDETKQLTANVAPGTATDNQVTWSSSDESIATVGPDGVVTGVGPGVAYITVTTRDGGKTAQCAVTVTQPVTGVTISDPTASIMVDGTKQLTANVEPGDASNDQVTWNSSDESIATVSPAGVVTGVGPGVTYITVTTQDGGFQAQCAVTVIQPVTGVTVSDPTATVKVDETKQLTANVEPGNATDNQVTWSSSDESIATVSPDGIVTGVGPGVAYITVTTRDGGKTAQCAVTVTQPATGVTISDPTASIMVDGTKQLTANVEPGDASNDQVTWSSSDESIATVSPAGVVTGVGPGVAYITVTTKDGGYTAQCAVTVIQPVTSVTVSVPTAAVKVDETKQLTATVEPGNASNDQVTWSSSDESIATVSPDGAVTGVGPGVAYITVTTKDGGKTAQCVVTVTQPATGVTVSDPTASIMVDATKQLTANVEPGDASNDQVTWSSSDESIATVSPDGVVTGIGPGVAYITVTTKDGGYTAQCVVTVIQPVTGVTVSDPTAAVKVDETKQLTANVEPGDAFNDQVTWSSSDESIATVSPEGVVTGVGPGVAYITVTTKDGGKTAQCTVTVIQPATGVTLDKTETSVDVDATELLIATVWPANASNKGITWSSSDPNIATVSPDGIVTGVGPGVAYITATTKDGGKTAQCTVTVIQPTTGITLDKATATINTGDTEPLTATVAPADVTDKNVTWSSNNNGIATVSPDGVVTGVGPGVAYITVTTRDGGYQAQCTITVIQPATGITLDRETASVNVGATETLVATVWPGNASNKNVVWSSSNPDIATVRASGVVTGIVPGVAVITVTTQDGGHTAQCTVTVIQPATGIILDQPSLTLPVGETERLEATVEPADVSENTVVWSSSNPDVVAVGPDGTVTALAPGTAVITATTQDGKHTAQCVVTVTQPATGIILDQPSLTLPVGETERLEAIVEPGNASDKNVIWSSSNPDIVAVGPDGTVTALAPGTAVITVTTQDGGHTAQCVVTVTPPVTGISIDQPSLTLPVGETEQLEATVEPADATDNTIVWSSSNPDIVAVGPDGTVTALAPGTAVITVTTQDGGHTAQCVVTVTPPVTGISIDQPSLTLPVGETEQLEATVEPADATDNTIVWSSSNPDIVAVGPNGTVTALAPGVVVITATTQDGRHTAQCTVTVAQPVANEGAAPNLRVYPNPFSDALHLVNAEGCTLRVFMDNGALMHVQRITDMDATVQLEHLPAGIYFCRLEKDGQMRTVKVVKFP